MAWYRSGTVSVTNGSATVTGSGTDWVAGVGIGEAFNGPDGKVYEIASIVSATQLTLGSVYLGATASGQAYQIIPSQSYIRDLAAQAAQLVSDYASVVSNAGSGKFSDGTAAAPGIRFTADENVGIRRAGADDMRLVANGQDKVTITGSGVSIPTLTSNPTLSAGTANGVLYLNGSKVATSGSALTFDGASAVIGNSGTVLGAASLTLGSHLSIANAGKQFLWSSGNGFAWSMNAPGDAVAWYNNSGTEQMRLTSTGLGIGTSSPNAKLEVVGNARISNASTAATNTALTIGSYSLSSGNAYGATLRTYHNFGASGASSLAFEVSGTTEAMRLDASGNLGIGTSSPAAKLDVSGAADGDNVIRASANSSNGLIILRPDGANGNALRWGGNGADANTLRFVSGGDVERMRIDASGNLGLGVTPSASWFSGATALQFGVGGGLASSSSYTGLTRNTIATSAGFAAKYLASAAASMYLQGNGTHEWHTAPSGTAGNPISFTQAMTLDASGNLGIGTTSPGQRLDVAGNILIRGLGANSGPRPLFGITYGTATYTAAFNAIQFNVAGGTGLDDNLAISFSTQNNGVSGERARIDSGGNLLVGTTTTSYDQFGLKYRADLGTLLSTSNNNPGFLVNRQGTTGVLIDFYHANNAVGNIATNGSNTSYNTSSDYRLKNITGPVTNSGAYIDSLNPVEGTWKADGSTFVGLIAHEVQEVSRTQVATGEKDGEQMQAMDYSNSELIANLIAEVQALRKRVAQLEAR